MTRIGAKAPFKARRVALLVQLAFVGLLVVGRIAGGVADSSMMPAFGSWITAKSIATHPDSDRKPAENRVR